VDRRGSRGRRARRARPLAADGRLTGTAVDLAHDAAVEQLRRDLTETHSDVDLLVNAAGVFAPKPFFKHDREDYGRYEALNRAFFFVTQAVAANLVARHRAGAIVNIGSMWAHQAVAATPSWAYSMATPGPHSLTQHLAMELAGHRIRVNAVAPAVVRTEDVAEDVAETVAFLLSDAASWVTARSGTSTAASWPAAADPAPSNHHSGLSPASTG
jgi:NAD(P)-dependent dehydrogenase (short-subunit alcohol dehydrogenase family)